MAQPASDWFEDLNWMTRWKNDRYEDPDDRMQEIRNLLRSDGEIDESWLSSLRFLYFADFDERMRRIYMLLHQLEQAIKRITSLAWEADYQRSDSLEEIQVLRQLLRDGIYFSDRDDMPSALIEAVEASRDNVVTDLSAALLAEKAKNWELSYQCKDMDEDIWELSSKLRNSIIPMGNVTHPRWRQKTAMEQALEDKVVELEGKLRNPKGRGRSASF